MIHHAKQRFYCLGIQQDIFGEWAVQKVFGGINHVKPRICWEYCKSELEASQRMFDLECLRRQHGYVYADTNPPEDYCLTPELIGNE